MGPFKVCLTTFLNMLIVFGEIYFLSCSGTLCSCLRAGLSARLGFSRGAISCACACFAQLGACLDISALAALATPTLSYISRSCSGRAVAVDYIDVVITARLARRWTKLDLPFHSSLR